jgi:nitrogen-specific signal transduction histidine kinase
MRRLPNEVTPIRDDQTRMVRSRAAMRLLSAERAEEIFPVLLEEIVAIGFPRALVLAVDFESSEIKPTAALNCANNLLKSAQSSLWAVDNPVVAALHSGTAAVVSSPPFAQESWYCHPILYRNRHQCWEAECDPRSDCLAVLNDQGRRKLHLQDQVCRTCDLRAYAAIVLVDLKRGYAERQLRECSALIDLSNRYLSRLFKVEHYYDRMRDMETTIGQMETVMRRMADPVILTDTQDRMITQNHAAEKFFKVPGVEYSTEGAARAVEMNNLLFSAALSSMAGSGVDTSRDLTLVDVNEGEDVLFEAVCAPTFNRDGRRTGMVTVMRDVTDLRRADEELRASVDKLLQAEEIVRQDRDRLNLVIENVGDPIVLADSAAKIVLLDSLAKELFGDGDNQGPEIVKNRARLDAYLTGFTFSFAEKANASLRLYHPGSNSEVEYEARSGKIFDARGRGSYTVTVLRDFSAWRRLEQLKMERRMLEMEKFAATGRLAGTIAHEINNPMEAIKNAIYLLQTHVKPKGEPVYSVLKGETERVARIVRQMLGLYRTSEQVCTMDVNSVIEDTLALFSRQLERANVTPHVVLSKLPTVVGSSDQLRQVMSNLVVNARDSMPKGGSLTIRTRHISSRDGVRGFVRIAVADNGTGIPKEVLPNIFEPFVSTKGEKGTGLGLWIVKGIVENHGGKLRVRSQVGKGTVFLIDFPVVRT